jgi:double-stranded uracil-DNA glycosylase
LSGEAGPPRVSRNQDPQRFLPGEAGPPRVSRNQDPRRFSRDELEGFRNTTVADLVDDNMRLLFVGINPGLWTAATQTHFAHPGNRFYPALLRGGVITLPINPSTGMNDRERRHLIERGIGITNIVDRATPRAAELSRDELRRGAEHLTAKIAGWRPRVVAIAGITAYRVAFERPRAAVGRQHETLAGAELWIVPNPSGLNTHETITSLAAAYRRVAKAAGVEVLGTN